MSASNKKKLRKEQNAAVMTEKQQQAQKDAKKLRIYTISFIVVMVLVASIVLGSVLKTPVNGIVNRNTHALTLGDRELNSVQFNYFYIDTIMELYSTYYEEYKSYGAEYVDMFISMASGMNTYEPLSEQIYDEETKETWSDHMIAEAIKTARWTYATYDLALSKNFKLPEESQEVLDKFSEVMANYAKAYHYSNGDSYLRGMYGAGSTVESYREYYEISLIANAYANEFYDGLKYTDEQFREYESDKYNEYNSYSYATYYVPIKDFLTGGTTQKDENGKETTVYSVEEKAAAEKAAKELAESLANSNYNSVTKLNKAIEKWAKEQKKKEIPTATESYNKLYNYVNNIFYTGDVAKWILDDARQKGDISCIPYTTKDKDDKETLNGYYVVLFLEENENTYLLPTIRYSFVAFDGTPDKDTGEMIYTDEEKKSTQKYAEKLIAEFRGKDKTDEEAFISFVKLVSDDKNTKENGGLMEDINYDTSLDSVVIDWALSEHKKEDTAILEGVHGYFIVFYVKEGDTTYRDSMLHDVMAGEEYTKWVEDLTESVSVTKHNLNRIDQDIIVANRV